MPTYGTPGAAAFDIRAAEDFELDWLGEPYVAVPTGLRMEIPHGYELQIRPRSGLSTKGVIILNSPGTIDSDYRGEIKVLMKLGRASKTGHMEFERGDRIAQGVLAPVAHASFQRVDELSPTRRGAGGFGSTGLS